MINRRSACLAFCLGLLPIRASARSNREVLLIKQYLNPDGSEAPLPAFLQRLISYLEEELQLYFDVQTYPWKRGLALAAQGKGLVWGLSSNTRRQAVFDFSATVRTNDIWMITRAGERFPCHRIEDLRGKVVSVFRGNVLSDDFERHRGQLFQVQEDVDSTPIRLRRLLAGRVDVVLLTTHNKTRDQLQASLDKQTKQAGLVSVLDKPLIKDPVHFAYAKSANKRLLLRRIDVAIQKAKHQGIWQQFLQP
ncbi:ABC-type amino acid transport substrate-binding protein [Chitinivorax tropicus]|uniref:ABC-type amino acid transport substrate-binding protein n=1 Tax=Chitinivorax tropicus TaxID=714531 RepID=A0A840MNM7_9PROT|nr:transporter substrate-binding domain-containing protein [Chitinivorax tropicus]MBB5016851.1 ABC-type amino acid transport substrate-binding protein [Chitinivorax tropicus]